MDAELLTVAVPGAARVHQRGALAAVRQGAAAAPVSVPAIAAGLQQAAAHVDGHLVLVDRRTGPGDHVMDR
jgi:hypothetical protein